MSDDFAATDLRDSPIPRAHHAEGRFTPGSVLARRYRVVALLGAGGMGEVYRADDVKLGQRIALKFVPAALAQNRAALERLYAEVRIGRQISHPNVCRLYDIVEFEDNHFITMEYVDGEDLASLLRRIGRLPAGKALSLAKAICSGLAAAHDRGVVHRDLKPANIMIDGQGQARITDFGLAVLSGDVAHLGERAGTLAYMAPEQLDGSEATARSDIYALGLVLYEMFTGRRVFDGSGAIDIRQQHATTKSRPSSVVDGMDPNVERLILRCIDENPAARPSSVHAVIAALPGGDPLQAALAAGETPSPEMVAAAGRVGDLTPARAWMLLGGIVAMLALATFVRQKSTVEGYVPRPKSREVLADRARQVVATLTGSGEPADRHFRYFPNTEWLESLAARSSAIPVAELRRGNPSAISFYYRESPVTLVPTNVAGRVTNDNPPPNVPGMASVLLDAYGRLLSFERVPPSASDAAPREVDWRRAFQEASLDIANFKEVAPKMTPPHGFDRQHAWEGIDTETQRRVRVEAASHRGVPVYFEAIGPWKRPVAAGAASRENPGDTVLSFLIICAIFGGAIIARRNVRAGRSDRRGAVRVGVAVFLLFLAAQLCVMDHMPSLSREWDAVSNLVASSLWVGGQCWLYYLAVEPYVRRRWPHALIGWTRLLAGRIRDPLVGRDILFGILGGTVAITIAQSWPFLSAALGLKGMPLTSALWKVGMDRAAGFGHTIGFSFYLAVIYALGWVTVLVLVRLFVKSDRAALIVFWIVGAATTVTAESPVFDFCLALVYMAVPALVFRYAGLLALTASFFAFFMIDRSPMTFDMAQFFAARSVAVTILLVAIASYAFHASLAGKPLFGAVLAEEEATT